jgi:hypothetical protein
VERLVEGQPAAIGGADEMGAVEAEALEVSSSQSARSLASRIGARCTLPPGSPIVSTAYSGRPARPSTNGCQTIEVEPEPCSSTIGVPLPGQWNTCDEPKRVATSSTLGGVGHRCSHNAA